ncbi:MAG TPA: TolC family protein [Terriglobales bacterium]
MAMAVLSTVTAKAQNSGTPRVLTLDEAIQLAIANNRTLKIASLEMDKSKWQIAEVKTQRLPSFSATVLGSQLLNEVDFTFPAGSFGSYPGIGPIPSTETKVTTPRRPIAFISGQATQPLSQLYKIHLGIRSQELNWQLSGEKAREQRQAVIKEVKEAYYAILQSESALDAADANVKQYMELDRVVLQRVSQEAALQSDSLEVKAKLAQEQYQLVQLQNSLQSRKEYLNDLLGRDISTDFSTEQVPAASFEEIELARAQRMALDQRPEIKQAELNVKQAEYARRIAKADYIPEVGVAFNYTSNFNVDVLPSNMTSLGVEFKWEPWEWGRRKDVVNQKMVVENQARTQLRDVHSKVLMDVNQRFRKLEETRSLISVARAEREASQQKLHEVTNQYKEQAVLLSEVLRQQASAAGALDQYRQALLGFWTAKADFEKAMGGDQ